MINERYIVTSVILGAKVNHKVFDSIKALTDFYDATLLVLPINYQPATDNYIELPKDIKQYIVDKSKDINIKNVKILNSINIRPTAKKPLVGLGAMSDNEHLIVAHPRIHRVDNPGLTGILQTLTTGVCTVPKYTRTKLGATSEFHHTYGCVIIEVSNSHTHIRQVTFTDEGEAFDLHYHVKNKKVTESKVDAIVFGDIHETKLSQAVRDFGFFGDKSLMRLTRPDYVMLHDLIDVLSVSHHNTPFRKYSVVTSGLDIVDEINSAILFLENIKAFGVTPVVIASNHNEHLTKWLENVDWRDYPEVAKEILTWTLMVLEELDESNDPDAKVPDVLRLILERYTDAIMYYNSVGKIAFNSFIIDAHGDKGLNGARNLHGLPYRSTSKMIIGHTHSASRIDGIITVGTSSELTRNYTYGLSTWSHTHALITSNNKAQLVTQCQRTGLFTIGKTNSKLKFYSEIKHNKVPIPENAKYKLVNTAGDIIGYIEGYRAAAEYLGGSDWKAREVVLNGKEREGIIAESLHNHSTNT